MITLGCDPEFTLHEPQGQRLVPASRALGWITDGPLGCDGAGTPAEVRPGVSDTPAGLVLRIAQTIKGEAAGSHEAADRARPYAWRAGEANGGHPIGGHVHVGGDATRLDRIHLGQHADALALGWWLRVADRSQRAQRRARGYGAPGDIREQRWGWEYRSLGSWLLGPAVALAAISLVRMATRATATCSGHCRAAHAHQAMIKWPAGAPDPAWRQRVTEADLLPPDGPDACEQDGFKIAARLAETGRLPWRTDARHAWGVA